MRRHSLLKKRCAAAALALLLAFAAALPALAAEPGFINFQNKGNTYTDGMFPDVPSDWYTTYVAAVYELGLMKGDDQGRFNPAQGVTLAETATLAARLHKTWHTGDGDFTQGQPWYQVYVDYCTENGILTQAYADYNAAARRCDFAGILARALPESALPEINAVADGDIPDVPADAAAAQEIYTLYRAGILTGNDEYGMFLPESDIKRSEVAAVVSRMAYRALRREFTLTPKPPYPVLREGERKGDDFFSDAAMVGNSLVDGMMLCAGIPMSYYGKTSGTVRSNRVGEMLQRQFGKIYIQLGINDLGGAKDTFIDGYRGIIERIRAALPEADIYVMAITPVTKARSAEGAFTMAKIREFNSALYDLAEEMQCWYLDCCEPLCDAEGYLPTNYGGWDGSPHLDASGYVAWAEVIRTHYAQEG